MSTPKPARASSDRLLSTSTTKTMSQWPPECRRWHRVRHSRRLKKESEKQIPQCTPSLVPPGLFLFPKTATLQIIMSIWPRAISPDTEPTIPNSCRDHSSVTKLFSCHFRQRLESHRTDSMNCTAQNLVANPQNLATMPTPPAAVSFEQPPKLGALGSLPVHRRRSRCPVRRAVSEQRNFPSCGSVRGHSSRTARAVGCSPGGVHHCVRLNVHRSLFFKSSPA